MTFIQSDVFKLLVALFLGAIIGAEREYQSKAVGFRTIILITLGSCLFTVLSSRMAGSHDPTRIAANIITGIGFLGAGAIFREGGGIKGITTAAIIWISAAIGMTVGIGLYQLAVEGTALVMIVLLGFTWFRNIIDKSHSNKIYKITLSGHSEDKRKELEKIFLDCGIKADCMNYSKRSNEMVLIYTIQGSKLEHDKLIKNFYETSLVDSFEC